MFCVKRSSSEEKKKNHVYRNTKGQAALDCGATGKGEGRRGGSLNVPLPLFGGESKINY